MIKKINIVNTGICIKKADKEIWAAYAKDKDMSFSRLIRLSIREYITKREEGAKND
jgi:predicted house-cleaning NTP pyrophosphatase (Maf/HAM1 superfamily)